MRFNYKPYAIALTLLVLYNSCAVPLEHRIAQGSDEAVSGIVEMDTPSLNKRIHEVLDLRDPDSPLRANLPPPFNHFVSSSIPAIVEYQLKTESNRNKQLAGYAHTDPRERQQDVYFFDPQKRYWSTEYYSRGSPIPFTTDFIIHLTPINDLATRVEILEFSPNVRLPSASFGITHEGLPWFYSDIRFVAPTKTEPKLLLTIIKKLR